MRALLLLGALALTGFVNADHQESNDVPGLQRGDEVASGTCHGMIAPDTIVF